MINFYSQSESRKRHFPPWWCIQTNMYYYQFLWSPFCVEWDYDPDSPLSVLSRISNRSVGDNQKANGQRSESLDDFTWKGYGMLIVSDQHELAKSATHRSTDSGCQAPTIETCYLKQNKHQTIPPLLSYTTFATPNDLPPQIIFPISADHCFITLVQYNVIRAMIFNMAILSLLNYLPHGCTSTFNVPALGIVSSAANPPDLRYTPLQQSTPHPY